MEFSETNDSTSDEPIYFFGAQSVTNSVGLDEMAKLYIDKVSKVVASIFVVAYSVSEMLEELRKYKLARKVGSDLEY